MELQLIQNKIYELRGLRVMLDFADPSAILAGIDTAERCICDDSPNLS